MSKIVQLVIANQQRDLAVKEYRGQRVVTLRDVDELHGRPEGTASRNFIENKERFHDGKHFFKVGRDEFRGDLWEAIGFNKFAPNGTLLTEIGYLMLVKSLTDDRAWEVQEQLIDVYFRAKSLTGPKDNILRQAEIEARLRNAKTRQAKLMTDIAEGFKSIISGESIQLLLAGATELLMGKALLPKPRMDVHFTATEIAEELGVSANKIGRVANKLNLKTSEYGKWVLDKAAHSDKQVRSFLYNEKGRAAVVDALNRELRVVPVEKPEVTTTTPS